MSHGIYGWWTPSQQQMQRLKQIFSAGVCDYTQPDQALPDG
jgi:hypothetical protein